MFELALCRIKDYYITVLGMRVLGDAGVGAWIVNLDYLDPSKQSKLVDMNGLAINREEKLMLIHY